MAVKYVDTSTNISKDRVVYPASEYKGYGKYFIPVKFFNPKNGKPVFIEVLIDTGAIDSIIGSREAEKIGINIEDGDGPYSLGSGLTATPSSWKNASFYIHKLKIQIGNLKPVTVDTWVMNAPADAVIGWKNLLSKYRLTTSFDSLSIENFLTAVVPFIGKGKERPDAYIYIMNIENGNPVKVPVTIDTGGYTTIVDKKYMRLVGINAATIPKLRKFTHYGEIGYAMKLKLAPTLRPITMDVYFQDLSGTGWEGIGLLGMGTLLKDKKSYNITFERDRVKYEEAFYGTKGVSNSGRNYRNRYI